MLGCDLIRAPPKWTKTLKSNIQATDPLNLYDMYCCWLGTCWFPHMQVLSFCTPAQLLWAVITLATHILLGPLWVAHSPLAMAHPWWQIVRCWVQRCLSSQIIQLLHFHLSQVLPHHLVASSPCRLSFFVSKTWIMLYTLKVVSRPSFFSFWWAKLFSQVASTTNYSLFTLPSFIASVKKERHTRNHKFQTASFT